MYSSRKKPSPAWPTRRRGHNVTKGNASKGESFGLNASVTYNITGSRLTYQSTFDGAAQLQLYYGGAVPFFDAPDFRLPFNEGFFTLNFSSLSIPTGKTLSILGVASEEVTPNGYEGNGTLLDVATSGSQTINIPVPDTFTANHSQIDALFVTFTPPNGASFQLDSIEFTAVPEPSALLLMGLGGVMMLLARRAVASC